MRKKTDPVPPGAEIYWGDHSFWWFLLWYVGLPFLAILVGMLLVMPPKSSGDWTALAFLILLPAIAAYGIRRAFARYTLMDASRVEIGYPGGKTVTFSMDEITGYRFGKLLGAEKVFHGRYRYSDRNIRLWFGPEQSRKLDDIPGFEEVMKRLRTLGLEPQWFPPEECPDSFVIRRSMRVEGDLLIYRGEETPLSEIRVTRPIASTVLTRPNGERIVKINDDTMNNIDLLAWKLEQNGVSVGSYLPKL